MLVKNNITSDREVIQLIDSTCLKCKIKRLVGLGTMSWFKTVKAIGEWKIYKWFTGSRYSLWNCRRLHWRASINLEVTEKPVVDEDESELSGSEELPG